MIARLAPLVPLVPLVLGGAGCQHDITTVFPAGLEPLEPNEVPTADGAPTEMLRTSDYNEGFIHVYGDGYVLEPPATVWHAVKDPDVDVASCTTDDQTVTNDPGSAYELEFTIAYTVHEFLTVQWDDQWRFGVITGTDAAPELGMVKHQKVDGSSFITLSEGTVQILSTDDPNVTEVQFVEHLNASGGSTATVLKGVQHNYDSIVAIAHGLPIPACP